MLSENSFCEGFFTGINTCSGDKDGIKSLKERKGGPKVGMSVGRAMAELTLGPGSNESKVGGASDLGAKNWVC